MEVIARKFRHCLMMSDTWAMVSVAGIYLFSLLIHFNIPTTSLGMYNLAIPLFSLAILGIYHDLLPEVWQHYRRTFILTFVFYSWLWVSAFLGEHTTIAIKYTIKYTIYFFVFPAFLTLSYKFFRDRKLPILYAFLCGFTLLISGFGIIEYFHPQFPLLLWIRNVNITVDARLTSLFDSSTKLGVMMAFGVLNAYIVSKFKYINQYIAIAIGILCLGIGILSGSRNFVFTLLLTTILGLFPLKVFSKREVFNILLLSTTLVIILWGTSPRLVTKLGDTVRDTPHNWQVMQELWSGNEERLLAGRTPSRLRIWYASIHEFEERPLTGMGLGVFSCQPKGLNCGEIGGVLNTHNIFLGLLVEIGIPGLVLLGGIIISTLWRSRWFDPRVGFLCSYILTSQLLDFFIHDFTNTITMILILSVASCLQREHETI